LMLAAMENICPVGDKSTLFKGATVVWLG
jgi:hypothetical protein